MPRGLGYITGVSPHTELIIMTFLSMVNAIMDWRWLYPIDHLQQVWNLPVAEMAFNITNHFGYYLKTILSIVVLIRTFTTPLHVVFCIVMYYPIFTKSRPNLILPWLILHAFKNIAMDLVITVAGLLLCWAQLGLGLAACEFLIVQTLSMIPSIYLSRIVRAYYLYLTKPETFDDDVHPSSGRPTSKAEALAQRRRACKQIEGAVLIKVPFEKRQRVNSFSTIDEFFGSPVIEIGDFDAKCSRSLTTLLTNASQESDEIEEAVNMQFIDDPNLTPAEKSLKILGMTRADVTLMLTKVNKIISTSSLERKSLPGPQAKGAASSFSVTPISKELRHVSAQANTFSRRRSDSAVHKAVVKSSSTDEQKHIQPSKNCECCRDKNRGGQGNSDTNNDNPLNETPSPASAPKFSLSASQSALGIANQINSNFSSEANNPRNHSAGSNENRDTVRSKPRNDATIPENKKQVFSSPVYEANLDNEKLSLPFRNVSSAETASNRVIGPEAMKIYTVRNGDPCCNFVDASKPPEMQSECLNLNYTPDLVGVETGSVRRGAVKGNNSGTGIEQSKPKAVTAEREDGTKFGHKTNRYFNSTMNECLESTFEKLSNKFDSMKTVQPNVDALIFNKKLEMDDAGTQGGQRPSGSTAKHAPNGCADLENYRKDTLFSVPDQPIDRKATKTVTDDIATWAEKEAVSRNMDQCPAFKHVVDPLDAVRKVYKTAVIPNNCTADLSYVVQHQESKTWETFRNQLESRLLNQSTNKVQSKMDPVVGKWNPKPLMNDNNGITLLTEPEKYRDVSSTSRNNLNNFIGRQVPQGYRYGYNSQGYNTSPIDKRRVRNADTQTDRRSTCLESLKYDSYHGTDRNNTDKKNMLYKLSPRSSEFLHRSSHSKEWKRFREDDPRELRDKIDYSTSILDPDSVCSYTSSKRSGYSDYYYRSRSTSPCRRSNRHGKESSYRGQLSHDGTQGIRSNVGSRSSKPEENIATREKNWITDQMISALPKENLKSCNLPKVSQRSSRLRNPGKSRVVNANNWGTVTVAETAHPSGFEKLANGSKFSVQNRIVAHVSGYETMFLRKPLPPSSPKSFSKGGRRSKSRDRRSVSSCPKSPRSCCEKPETPEERDARFMRKLRAYNEKTLLKYKREMETMRDSNTADELGTKKVESDGNIGDKCMEGPFSPLAPELDAPDRLLISNMENAYGRLTRSKPIDRSAKPSSVEQVSASIYNCCAAVHFTNDDTTTRSFKINKKDATEFLELLNSYEESQLKRESQEIKSGAEVVQHHSDTVKPRKYTAECEIRSTSGKNVEGSQKGRDLDKTPAKENIRWQSGMRCMDQPPGEGEASTSNGVQINTIKSVSMKDLGNGSTMSLQSAIPDAGPPMVEVLERAEDIPKRIEDSECYREFRKSKIPSKVKEAMGNIDWTFHSPGLIVTGNSLTKDNGCPTEINGIGRNERPLEERGIIFDMKSTENQLRSAYSFSDDSERGFHVGPAENEPYPFYDTITLAMDAIMKAAALRGIADEFVSQPATEMEMPASYEGILCGLRESSNIFPNLSSFTSDDNESLSKSAGSPLSNPGPATTQTSSEDITKGEEKNREEKEEIAMMFDDAKKLPEEPVPLRRKLIALISPRSAETNERFDTLEDFAEGTEETSGDAATVVRTSEDYSFVFDNCPKKFENSARIKKTPASERYFNPERVHHIGTKTKMDCERVKSALQDVICDLPDPSHIMPEIPPFPWVKQDLFDFYESKLACKQIRNVINKVGYQFPNGVTPNCKEECSSENAGEHLSDNGRSVTSESEVMNTVQIMNATGRRIVDVADSVGFSEGTPSSSLESSLLDAGNNHSGQLSSIEPSVTRTLTIEMTSVNNDEVDLDLEEKKKELDRLIDDEGEEESKSSFPKVQGTEELGASNTKPVANIHLVDEILEEKTASPTDSEMTNRLGFQEKMITSAYIESINPGSVLIPSDAATEQEYNERVVAPINLPFVGRRISNGFIDRRTVYSESSPLKENLFPHEHERERETKRVDYGIVEPELSELWFTDDETVPTGKPRGGSLKRKDVASITEAETRQTPDSLLAEIRTAERIAKKIGNILEATLSNKEELLVAVMEARNEVSSLKTLSFSVRGELQKQKELVQRVANYMVQEYSPEVVYDSNGNSVTGTGLRVPKESDESNTRGSQTNNPHDEDINSGNPREQDIPEVYSAKGPRDQFPVASGYERTSSIPVAKPRRLLNLEAIKDYKLMGAIVDVAHRSGYETLKEPLNARTVHKGGTDKKGRDGSIDKLESRAIKDNTAAKTEFEYKRQRHLPRKGQGLSSGYLMDSDSEGKIVTSRPLTPIARRRSENSGSSSVVGSKMEKLMNPVQTTEIFSGPQMFGHASPKPIEISWSSSSKSALVAASTFEDRSNDTKASKVVKPDTISKAPDNLQPDPTNIPSSSYLNDAVEADLKDQRPIKNDEYSKRIITDMLSKDGDMPIAQLIAQLIANYKRPETFSGNTDAVSFEVSTKESITSSRNVAIETECTTKVFKDLMDMLDALGSPDNGSTSGVARDHGKSSRDQNSEITFRRELYNKFNAGIFKSQSPEKKLPSSNLVVRSSCPAILRSWDGTGVSPSSLHSPGRNNDPAEEAKIGKLFNGNSQAASRSSIVFIDRISADLILAVKESAACCRVQNPEGSKSDAEAISDSKMPTKSTRLDSSPMSTLLSTTQDVMNDITLDYQKELTDWQREGGHRDGRKPVYAILASTDRGKELDQDKLKKPLSTFDTASSSSSELYETVDKNAAGRQFSSDWNTMEASETSGNPISIGNHTFMEEFSQKTSQSFDSQTASNRSASQKRSDDSRQFKGKNSRGQSGETSSSSGSSPSEKTLKSTSDAGTANIANKRHKNGSKQISGVGEEHKEHKHKLEKKSKML